jgi:hypothetical protein
MQLGESHFPLKVTRLLPLMLGNWMDLEVA